MTHPISLLVCALGGEGGGVLTEWLVETAHRAGYAAQSTSIPGVAQRTGATTYYIEVFPVALAQLGGRRPVFSLNPVPGALDAIVSSELLETARQIAGGMSSADRTLVITSSSRALTVQERMQLGDGRADSATLGKVVGSFSREHHLFDMGAVAKEAGTVVSAVMLGAVAGSGLFPFAREDYEEVVGAGGGPSAQASLRGFSRGFEVVSQSSSADRHAGLDPASTSPRDDGLRLKAAMTGSSQPAMTASSKPAMTASSHPAMTASSHPAVTGAFDDFPAEVHDMLSLGHARMLEYQGPAYARLYLDRLRQVLASERASDPAATHRFAITREVSRWLALWMAFDDIVRVADLKSRGTRWQRVMREVNAGEHDVLKVYDHFKPGVPELAALLPIALATRLVAWDRQRVARGKQPWALPMKVGTHSVAGMLALRTLASLKWLRLRGSRYAGEQAMIGKWLAGVVEGTHRGWELGHEIALCGRLIKGYGATNERGKENLLHVLDHLAHGAGAGRSASAIRAARTAALADDAGLALDAALSQHGAPPRPVREQPIRFVRQAKGDFRSVR